MKIGVLNQQGFNNIRVDGKAIDYYYKIIDENIAKHANKNLKFWCLIFVLLMIYFYYKFSIFQYFD